VTAPVTSQPLIDALDAAVTAAGVAFGDGRKPSDATTRYIVAWFDAGSITDRSLRSRDGFSAVGTFHCYGQTPEAARHAYRVLADVILSLYRAEVGGRVLLMPEQLTSLPLQRDDNLTRPLFDAVCEWRFRTSPA
jgi:hypothetical protein